MRTFLPGLLAFLLLGGLGGVVEAGAANGSQERTHTVQAFRGVAYKMAFTPGQIAFVSVQGDGDTDLALVIYDAQGKRVTATKTGESPSIRWTPTSTAPYQIRIYNRGGVPNRFILKTN
jgi:hypothetical protein